jgi:hypothetical protein
MPVICDGVSTMMCLGIQVPTGYYYLLFFTGKVM